MLRCIKRIITALYGCFKAGLVVQLLVHGWRRAKTGGGRRLEAGEDWRRAKTGGGRRLDGDRRRVKIGEAGEGEEVKME